MARTTQRTPGAFSNAINTISNYVPGDAGILQYSNVNLVYNPVKASRVQQEKIKLCNRFINAFSGTVFFDKSFPANTGNGHDRAASVLMNKAIKGSYPDTFLSYPQVMISKGKLPGAIYAAAAPMKDGNLFFHFSNNSETGSATSSDKIILVAHSEVLQQAVFSLHAGLRKDCEAILQTAAFKGHHVETWMGFLSDDEYNASNSVYTGRHLIIK